MNREAEEKAEIFKDLATLYKAANLFITCHYSQELNISSERYLDDLRRIVEKIRKTLDEKEEF